MNIEQLYTKCLSEAAYFIESEGEIAIIDPIRDTQVYLDMAKQSGGEIKYIFETHFHADFVSGHVDLAEQTGAQIVFGPGAETSYDSLQASDNQIFKLGNIELKVLHTPGHTLESMCLLLFDENGKEQAVFSGDTLFLGDVGRPDLAVKSDLTQAELAAKLFQSLRTKLMPLPDDILVYPAHGAGSACGKNLSKDTVDTLGNQKKTNYALRADMTEQEFIDEVTSGLSKPPHYFPENVKLNKSGYESLTSVLKRSEKGLSASELETYQNKGALVLDTRKANDFCEGHIPNSWFIGIDGGFAPWVGALIEDINQNLIVVCDMGREEEVLTRLARVGYTNVIGVLEGGFESWKRSEKPIASIENIDAQDLKKKLETAEVLDVRKPGEYNAQHLDSSRLTYISLDDLQAKVDQLEDSKTYFTHCAGGYRSVIAISILKSMGKHQFVNVLGGFGSMKKADFPMLEATCSSQA